MSDIGSGLYSLIQTKSAITSLVGTRVFTGILPQANVDGTKPLTLPAMTYAVISHEQSRDWSGVSAHADITVQMDLYAKNRDDVVALANAVRNELNNHDGAAGSEYFQSCFFQGAVDGFDSPIDGGPAHRYRISQDWRIHLVETVS